MVACLHGNDEPPPGVSLYQRPTLRELEARSSLRSPDPRLRGLAGLEQATSSSAGDAEPAPTAPRPSPRPRRPPPPTGAASPAPTRRHRRHPQVTVTVRPRVSARATASSTRLTVTGSVAPNHKGQRVYLQRLAGGAWKGVATAILTSASAYTLRARSPGKGTFSSRVVKRADSDHTGAISPTLG